MYLAKLSKVLSFAEKGRQIYNLVYFLSKPKNKEKVKKELFNCSNLQQQNLSTDSIMEPVVDCRIFIVLPFLLRRNINFLRNTVIENN